MKQSYTITFLYSVYSKFTQKLEIEDNSILINKVSVFVGFPQFLYVIIAMHCATKTHLINGSRSIRNNIKKSILDIHQ